jgi:glucose-1-phosphate thymidylyltransferase
MVDSGVEGGYPGHPIAVAREGKVKVDLLLFEDRFVDQLQPISTGRLVANVLCGGYRLVDLLGELAVVTTVCCRPYLVGLVRREFPQFGHVEDIPAGNRSERPRLWLNARLVPSCPSMQRLRQWLQAHAPGQGSGVVWDRDSVAAWIDPPWTWQELQATQNTGIDALLDQASQHPRIDLELPTLRMPHEVIARHMECMQGNLLHRIQGGAYQQLQADVWTRGPVHVGQYVLFDTTSGPIVLEEGVSIGPYTLLRGPIHLGRYCKVLEHAAIKDAVAASHTTKIGGEVEASIVEPFTNKQHHGFLGHSYLGSWINLGAGTCNSDLKNTYGSVNMEYHFGKVATGMQFLGCVMGDYSKTAINTGIFTGKVIGVCSMMYGFVTSNVPSFVNYARLFGQMATLPPEVMVATQMRMFARRKVEQTELDRQLVHDMYRLTQSERDRLIDA